MAFVLADDKGTIKVIVSGDSAVKCSPEEYQLYLKDLDESRLNLEGNPTRFVLKKRLDYKTHQLLIRAQAKVVGNKIQTDLASILEEVRIRLIDIENPADLPPEQHVKFIKDKDGYADKELIAALYSFGAVMEMQVAVKNSDNINATAETKKN